MTNSNHYIFTTTVPMVTKPGKLVTCHEGLLPIMILHPLVTCFCKIMWQTKTIFIYHKIYAHKTWQDGDLTWQPFTHKVKWPVTWFYEITWQIKNISLLSQCLRPQDLVGLEWLLPIKSHDHIITWCHKIIWETKTITLSMTINLWILSIKSPDTFIT